MVKKKNLLNIMANIFYLYLKIKYYKTINFNVYSNLKL